MNVTPADESSIRAYLLGKLAEPESDPVEQKLLTDPDFAKAVDLIEDELIERYLDGRLSATEARLMESHFFRPPERRRKLWFARLLRSYLGSPQERGLQKAQVWMFSQRSGAFIGAATAMIVLLCISVWLGVYSASLRHELDSETAKNSQSQSAYQQDLAKQRRQIAELEEQIEAYQGQALSQQVDDQRSVLVSNLRSGISRGDSDLQQIRLLEGTKWLEAHLSLLDAQGDRFRATLRDSDGKELWSKDGLKRPKSGGLVVKIPIQRLSPGDYSILLTAGDQTAESSRKAYYFRLSR
jgi:hypothetical protein